MIKFLYIHRKSTRNIQTKMAMYEGFNRTYGNKIRNFYLDNKELFRDAAIAAALLGAFAATSFYFINKFDREIKEDMKTLEKAVDMPRSDTQTLESNFYYIKNREENKK